MPKVEIKEYVAKPAIVKAWRFYIENFRHLYREASGLNPGGTVSTNETFNNYRVHLDPKGPFINIPGAYSPFARNGDWVVQTPDGLFHVYKNADFINEFNEVNHG